MYLHIDLSNFWDKQKKARIEISRQFLKHKGDLAFLDRIIIVKELWSKVSSSQWKWPDKLRPVKAYITPAARKMAIFWNKQGVLIINWLPEWQTINSDYYMQLLTKFKEIVMS